MTSGHVFGTRAGFLQLAYFVEGLYCIAEGVF